jgi:hypothetical protein
MGVSKDKKRVVTSAIRGMSVGKVRRHLDHMRRKWFDASNGEFFITETLPQDSDISIQNFALLFVKGQHQKRHNKGPSNCE